MKNRTPKRAKKFVISVTTPSEIERLANRCIGSSGADCRSSTSTNSAPSPADAISRPRFTGEAQPEDSERIKP